MCNEISADQLIRPDETMEDLQLGGLRLMQKQTGFRYGMDAVLLADFAQISAKARVVDFGTGTGILPLLLHGRGKGASFDAFEIQPVMADLAERNARLNGLGQTMRIHLASAADAAAILPRCSIDAVICNPPYGVSGTTLHNPLDLQDISRHQTDSGLLQWFKAAHMILKGKARISLIYPAPRMLQVMDLLRQAHLEPKRVRMVYPYAHRPANLVLIDAIKDGRPMLHPESPLIIYEANGAMTAELRRIYHLPQDGVAFS